MTTTTNAPTAPLAMIFGFGDSFVPRALEGLTHEELWHPLTSSNTPMIWVAGHVVQMRATVLNMLGVRADTGWGKLFDRGAKIGDPKDYPSGLDVARTMHEISPRLYAALASLQDEQLNRPASIPVPGLKTLMDELTFFAMHEAYHVGQLAYVRKGLGYPGLAG